MNARISFIFSSPFSRSRSIISQPPKISLRPSPSSGALRMSIISRKPSSCWTTNLASSYITRDSSGRTVISLSDFSDRPTPLWLVALILSAIFWLVRRIVILRHLARVYRRQNLKRDIADYYDIRSAAWEAVWGDHMHHGVYDIVQGKRLRGRDAQIRTMSELLRMGALLDVSLPKGARILDVGCGIGGASRFLARHFGDDCHVTGITLSPFQAERAGELNRTAGLQGRVQNIVRDAMSNGFQDNHFDVIWSLESGEHMEDKHNFIHECTRVLKPGGKFLMLVWCIRESTPPLKVSERFSVRRIMEEYCLPRLAPASEYGTVMLRCGLRNIEVEDWTKRAAPFWGEVVRSAAINPKGWAALLKNGWPLVSSTLAIRHIIAGIKQGVFRLVAISAYNPTESERRREIAQAVECSSKSSLPREK